MKFIPTEKIPTKTYRRKLGKLVTACSPAKWPSATTRSTAAGTPGLPELEREPRRHISEERSKEKPSEQRSQPMIKEYGEFHLSLRRLARRQYITVTAFPIPPEDENTRGVKLPLSTSRTRSGLIGTTFHTFMFAKSCSQTRRLVTVS